MKSAKKNFYQIYDDIKESLKNDDLANYPITDDNFYQDNDGYYHHYNDKNDVKFLNLLRHSIMLNIPNYQIDLVSIHKNKSALQDELLAHRLGLLIINNDILDLNNVGIKNKKRVYLEGPYDVLSNDIPDLPFDNPTPIVQLFDGDYVHFDVILRSGTGRDHVKYNPVSNIAIYSDDDKNWIKFKSIGIFSGKNIIKLAYQNIKNTLENEDNNLFFGLIL